MAAPHRAPKRGRARRIVSLLVALLIMIPIVALLPRVARAPELAPARAWSAQALQQTQSVWFKARDRARELWMKEPGGAPPPGQP